MNQNQSRSAFKLLLLVFYGCLMGTNVLAQETFPDLNIGNSSYTIAANAKEEYQNVNLNTNKSVLTVNGTLIVHGNLDMIGNQSQFIMGPEAIVIVYGDFISSNSVSITAKSYLIIYGSFINNTPSNTADLNVEGGNIYIFGTVDNWGEEFTTCEDYSGDTGEITTEECDYGTGDDFEDNAEDFPDGLIEVLPCMSYIWTGTEDADWNNPANWRCNKVPDISKNVTIPSGTTYYPVLHTGIDGAVKNLTVDTGALLTIVDRQLTIAGTLTIAGSIDAEKGSVALSGSAAQTIPSGIFSNDLVYNLTINNSESVTSLASIKVLNSLKVTNGSFETGNDLTLLSGESRTAYIDGSGLGEITGSVNMQRYLGSGFGYKYFSSPFNNNIVGDFSPYMDLVHPTTSFPHFYTYNENREDGTGEDISGWEAYIDPLGFLSPGTGYAANLSDTNVPVTVEISGVVNNGNISLNLENNIGVYTKGFHLVGNPYPSPIDWDLVSRTGIDDAVYFFTAGNEDRYTGTYTSYINGVSNDGSSSNLIASMQGFFVRVSDPGSTGTLEFTDAARVGNTNPSIFYKSNRNNFQSQLVLSAGFKNEKTQDALVLYQYPGSTYNFEKEFDAHELLNTSVEVPSFYTLTPAGEKLSINAVADLTTAAVLEIPLGLRALRSGEMSLNLKNVPVSLFSQHLYIKDDQEKVLWDLTKGPYSFTTHKGEFDNRFFLVLSPEKLSEKDLKSAFKTFEISTSSGEIIVETRLADGVEGDLQLISYSGQVLQKKKVNGEEEVILRGFSTGVYLVTLRSHEGEETRKILVQQ